MKSFNGNHMEIQRKFTAQMSQPSQIDFERILEPKIENLAENK